jgi:hypothetical protein
MGIRIHDPCESLGLGPPDILKAPFERSLGLVMA